MHIYIYIYIYVVCVRVCYHVLELLAAAKRGPLRPWPHRCHHDCMSCAHAMPLKRLRMSLSALAPLSRCKAIALSSLQVAFQKRAACSQIKLHFLDFFRAAVCRSCLDLRDQRLSFSQLACVECLHSRRDVGPTCFGALLGSRNHFPQCHSLAGSLLLVGLCCFHFCLFCLM